MATKTTVEQLQQQIADLQRELWRLSGRYVGPVEATQNMDYVEHGSDRHAALLGLKKAENGDVPQLDGWTLEDIVSFGPHASKEFLEQFLRQKVNELYTPPPEYQSRDPREPFFAPVMWRPGQPFSQTTE